MQVRYVPRFEIDAVLEPDAALWRPAKAETVKLKGTPIDMQPTSAIKVSWANKKIGSVETVQVAAIHDGERIAFRLEWSDPAELPSGWSGAIRPRIARSPTPRPSRTAAESCSPRSSTRPWRSWVRSEWR
jgi:hypothetical protein